MSVPTIAVYGATGHTGTFVVRELERRGCHAVRIGRNRAAASIPGIAGTECEWRIASCDDPDALDQALHGTEAVINCAGPFLDTAPALIEAALRCGVHYFDVTAEQRSVRQSLATYHQDAERRGIVVLPALAFYGGLADLLAAEITCGLGSVDTIEIAVALDYWHPTEGTRRTGQRNTARRLVVTDGQLAPMARPAPVRQWSFSEPFGQQEVVAVPLSEMVTIHRHIAVRNACSYMNLAPLRDLEDSRTPRPSTSDPSGRSSQRFVMEVHARSADIWRGLSVSGHDIYAITAPIIVEGCLRVLREPPLRGGAYAPAELLEADAILAALSPHLTASRSRTGGGGVN
jgi:short subunit dehydrogenase-like uncharacterized protein